MTEEQSQNEQCRARQLNSRSLTTKIFVSLDPVIDELIREYGYARVKAAVKQRARRGAGPRDRFPQMIKMGNELGAWLAGVRSEPTKYELTQLCLEDEPERNHEKLAQFVRRAWQKHELLGVAFALNRHWEGLDRTAKRNLVNRVAEHEASSKELAEWAHYLLNGSDAWMDDRPPSRGLGQFLVNFPPYTDTVDSFIRRLLSEVFPSGFLDRD
jgi:hypothetical protein